jgi:hypothetical protein
VIAWLVGWGEEVNGFKRKTLTVGVIKLWRVLDPNSGERGFAPWALPDSIVSWLALVLRRADAGTVALMRFADEIEDALNAIIGNPSEGRDAP